MCGNCFFIKRNLNHNHNEIKNNFLNWVSTFNLLAECDAIGAKPFLISCWFIKKFTLSSRDIYRTESTIDYQIHTGSSSTLHTAQYHTNWNLRSEIWQCNIITSSSATNCFANSMIKRLKKLKIIISLLLGSRSSLQLKGIDPPILRQLLVRNYRRPFSSLT